MARSIALCFDAPMQSWGLRSRGVLRDTAMEPTKSGVIGVVAAALGVERDDEKRLAQLAALRLGVRADREGLLERDYQTAQNVPTTTGSGHRTVVSERYYLADALFLVVLEGDEPLLAAVGDALSAPRWQLYLGRKAFVPTRPLFPAHPQFGGYWDIPVEQVLRDHPWLEHHERTRSHDLSAQDRIGLRTVTDCSPTTPGAEMRYDVPLSFAEGNRRFTARTVLTADVPLTDVMITTRKDAACS